MALSPTPVVHTSDAKPEVEGWVWICMNVDIDVGQYVACKIKKTVDFDLYKKQTSEQFK